MTIKQFNKLQVKGPKFKRILRTNLQSLFVLETMITPTDRIDIVKINLFGQEELCLVSPDKLEYN